MIVETKTIRFDTQGNADILDLTEKVEREVNGSEIKDGTVTLFSPSATSALTTIEFESGALSDFRRLFDEIADPNRHYSHNARWGDGNGHSHVRAALLGASFTIPVVNGSLTLGTWQHIVFVDFDNRPRRRELIVQIVGE
jgi:secondary thiamine-phosphate synthase enzyme